MAEWSQWLPFPDPRKRQFLNAPFGPGVYQVRHRSQTDMVLFGIGGHCAARMSSLLPKPLGTGTRNNSSKRKYLLQNIDDLEYRCLACESRSDAEKVERKIRSECKYLFAT
jgi:hypothetical protein